MQRPLYAEGVIVQPNTRNALKTAPKCSLVVSLRTFFWGFDSLSSNAVTRLPCVSEIGNHSNHSDASRFVHPAAKLDQENHVEMEIRINSSVYVEEGTAIAREHRTSSVTAGLGDVVEFLIDGATADSDTQRLRAFDATPKVH